MHLIQKGKAGTACHSSEEIEMQKPLQIAISIHHLHGQCLTFCFCKESEPKKYVKQCREVNHPGSGMTDDGSRYYLTGGLGTGRGRSGEKPHKNAKKFSVSLRAHHYSQYRRARR